MASLHRSDSMSSIGSADHKRHQREHSSSDAGRHVPMWDSSDPDRAPPPLPLNPKSGFSPTKTNTSAHIAAAAAALVERARDNAGYNAYAASNLNERLPEKSPTRTPQHKRLQSLQTGSLSSLRGTYENHGSSGWDGSRPGTPLSSVDDCASEINASRAETPTPLPSSRDLLKDTPVLRPSTRQGPRPILSENTPPSATKLAIQNMPYRDQDAPLRNITNSSAPPPNNTTPSSLSSHSMDTIHFQIQNLTNIAQNLQKEMSALSRRSKDNATDLVSLKEATSARNEDIRKSLHDLTVNFKTTDGGFLALPGRFDASRPGSPYTVTSRYMEEQGYNTTSPGKLGSIPRLLAPPMSDNASERAASPSPYIGDGTAYMVKLEKIIKEMATKEGQEHALSTLSKMLEKASKESTTSTKKFEELVEVFKNGSASQALVTRNGRVTSISDGPPRVDLELVRQREERQNNALSKQHDDSRQINKSDIVITEGLLNILQNIKDSIFQGGGLTGEVKSLVRELRGEVLGLGRELGRRLDEIELPPENSGSKRNSSSPGHSDVARIVQDGMATLKHQMDQFVEEKLQESALVTGNKSAINRSDIYSAVRDAIQEQGALQTSTNQGPQLDQKAILSAVREAYEAYKPEIELQQFGLERDEILQCLKEGLEDYQSSRQPRTGDIAVHEEVVSAVREAMQGVLLPNGVPDLRGVKNEVLEAVRECLEDHAARISDKSYISTSSLGREDILDVIREGFLVLETDGQKEVNINPESLESAVKAAMEIAQTPSSAYGDRILNSMQDIVDRLQESLKEHAMASEKDAERLLDAVQGSLNALQAEVQATVQRTPSSIATDEIMAMLKEELDNHRISVQSYIVEPTRDGSAAATPELKALLETEFDRLSNLLLEQQADGKGSGLYGNDIVALNERLECLKETLDMHGIGGTNDEINDAMKHEFEQVRETVLKGNALDKDEIIEAVQDVLQHIQQSSNVRSIDGGSDTTMAQLLKDEFDSLKATLAAPVLQYANAGDKEELLDKLQDFLEKAKVELTAAQRDSSSRLLEEIQKELSETQEKLGTAVVVGAPPANIELLEAIRDGLDGLQAVAARDGEHAEITDALDDIRDELEHLRETLAKTLVKEGQADNDDVLDSMRLGIDDVRARIEERLPTATTTIAMSENLRLLKDTLADVKNDLAKMADKQTEHDMTVSNDILKSIKSVQADIEHIRSDKTQARDGEIVLAEAKKHELEKVEVMLSQLRIKIEAMNQNMQVMDQNMQTVVPGGMVEAMLREIQAGITSLSDSNAVGGTDQVAKDGIDAIETLLLNTKAKLEEIVIPAVESAPTKEQFEDIEFTIKETSKSVHGMMTRLEDDLSTRDDLAAIGTLLQEVNASLTSMKDQLCGNDGNKTASKDDLDAVFLTCTAMKDTLESLQTAEHAPSKADVTELKDLLESVRKSQSSLKHKYENDIEVTAQAFDDRKNESKAMLDQIHEIKTQIDASTDELKSQVKRSIHDVRTLDELLHEVDDKLDSAPSALPVMEEVKSLVNTEFASAQKALADFRDNHDLKATILLEKHEEVQSLIIAELATRLDERFHELKAGYEQQRSAIEGTSQQMQGLAQGITDRRSEQDKLLATSKAMVEDLQLTINTLGVSVTGITPALAEATERMSDDSKTVFGKIEELSSKVDGTQAAAIMEHQLTRSEMGRSLETVVGLQQEAVALHPKFLDLLNGIMSIAAEHFEHSKQTGSDLKTSFATVPLPRLEAAPAPAPAPTQVVVQHDNSDIQEKLDRLLSHVTASKTAGEDASKIEEIHHQVMATAAEVAAFVSFQNKMATARHDNVEKEANEAARDLDRFETEIDDLEHKVVNLRTTKQSLAADVETLIVERDSLNSQKVRLNAEVSSLETALKIRREELQMMDERADSLERRIIDGVMDHSRMLLMLKSSKVKPNMNLKRVASSSSRATASTTTASNIATAGINMALKSRPPPRQDITATYLAGRRFVSLGQITPNVPAGGSALSTRQPHASSGLRSLKRTQPKTQLRKSTWAAGQTSSGSFDKENSILDDESEDEAPLSATTGSTLTSLMSRSQSYGDTDLSRNQRASSYGTTVQSEYSYDTSSYLTGTETDRRSSYGSTVRSRVTAEQVEEESGEDDEDDEHESNNAVQKPGVRDDGVDYTSEIDDEEEDGDYSSVQGEPNHLLQELHASDNKKMMALRGSDTYDSGLGSDLPTAALSDAAGSASYFHLIKGRKQEAMEDA